MPHAEFVHLRVHSAYSLSEGAIHIKQLAELCRAQRMPAVAITDSNNLFGALEFSEAMAGAGVQPILGCQINLARADAGTLKGRAPDPDSVVLLAQDALGWRNLMRLSSRAFLETPPGETPRVTLADLAAHNAGLLCLSGGPGGPVGRLLAEGQGPAAEAMLTRLKEIFPGRFYVELQRHGLDVERRVEPALLDLAYKLDLPLVATNDCHFADASMYEAHDALLCIAQGVAVAQTDRRRLTPEHRFKSAEEMRIAFADLPEAIGNTLVIARRCAVAAEKHDPILPHFPTADGETEADALRRQSEEGLSRRLAAAGIAGEGAAPYAERLAFELGVISRMGFAGYFLIVADFIQWAKRQGIPVGPGRGSGAGSVVAWALTITDLDPLRFGLLFERFLNPERVSMPDFDIDFCQERRDEVIRYVRDRYGADRVAHIITFGKLQARAALRDVGRVLQLPLGQVDRLCKMVPNNPAKPVTLKQAIESEPRLQEERDRDEAVARMMEIALRLEGLYRNASTHAAGVVIGDRPLVDLAPLYRDPRAALPATQYSMKYAELAGLVKFDFLGLKTLTVLERTRVLLKDLGVDLDLERLPLDDAATYGVFSRGETLGVFQMESAGMREALRQLRPDSFGDLVAMVALYRPGPMDNIPRYIHCKHGVEKPDYLHPMLEPVLRETQGVVIYQEQVMEIAKVMAGFSLGEADLLRRAMGKKIKSEMTAQKERFMTGAAERGVPAPKAGHVFEVVEKFAGYGFNKSHAAAYAVIAYQTAYCKAKYPAQFLAALMSLDLNDTDKLNLYRQELSRMGIALLPPDVNRSEVEFAVEAVAQGAAMRYALAAVKNVGAAAVASLVAERRKNGPYKGLGDFARRLDPAQINKRMLENLAKAGAFDGIEPDRARALASVDAILKQASAASAASASGQSSLFGEAEAAATDLPPVPATAPWNDIERLQKEFEAIGFYLSAHPLDSYGAMLPRLGVVRAADMQRMLESSPQRLRLAGTVIARQERTSAKGNRFAFVQCSDPSGTFEVTVFSEQLSAAAELLQVGRSLVFSVDARLDGEQTRVTVQSIDSLDKVAAQAAAGVRIVLADERPLAPLRDIFAMASRGRGLVSLVLRPPGRNEEVELRLPQAFAIAPPLRAALRAVPGIVEVQEL
jgi:DNA polymerase III subunit alpha